MKIIVGLGNPGEKYRNNRHNVGFMMVDYLLESYNSQLITQEEKVFFKKNKYLKSQIAECRKLQVTSYKLQDIILAKPQTFMNLSGPAIKACIKSYKLQVTSSLIVVHDDLDIPLGKFKIQKGVGPLLHNGIESIEKTLGKKDFWRIRIGVDNRPVRQTGGGKHWVDGETYVLEDFTPEERHLLDQTFPAIYSRLISDYLDLL